MKKLFSILLAICLIAGLLPVVASAAAATISFGHETGATSANVEQGQDPVYFITEDGKVHNNGNVANDGNYHVKVEYPAGGEPTIYLKGATITAPKNAIKVSGSAGGDAAYTIVVEEDSTVSSTNGDCISAFYAHLTITGSAKLNVDVKYGIGIQIYDEQNGYDLIFDDANINLTTDGTQGSFCLGVGRCARNIVFDGGTFVANSDKSAVVFTQTGTIKITNGAQVDITVNDQSAFSRGKRADFVMESGHLKLRTTNSAFGFSPDSTIAFKGGTVDFSGAAFIYGPKIDVSEYQDEHTIVVCQSKDGKGAEPYDAEKHNLSYMNYFQLTKGSSYEITVKNGTTDLSVANKGDTVTITARIAPDGKVFDKWEINAGNVKLADPTASSTTFTMPGENVKLTALYKSVESEDEPAGDGNNGGEETPEVSTPEESTPEVSTPEASAPEESTPVESTPDTNKNEGNKKPATGKKTNVTNVLLIVIIVILVLGIGAGAAFIVIRVKKLNAGDEESAEDAEAPAEDATEDAE